MQGFRLKSFGLAEQDGGESRRSSRSEVYVEKVEGEKCFVKMVWKKLDLLDVLKGRVLEIYQAILF